MNNEPQNTIPLSPPVEGTSTSVRSSNLPVRTEDLGLPVIDAVQLEHGQRVAKMFAQSKLVPDIYKGSVADCFIANHIANQLGVDTLMFMNKSYIVKGKFALEGQLVIAILNARGPYAPPGIDFEYSGEGDSRKCVCFGVRRDTGKRREAECSVEMARKAGWWSKQDSWWPKMTDQMLAYRAAAFLARRYDAHLLLGLQTIDEVRDITEAEVLTQGSLGQKLRTVKVEVLNAEGTDGDA